MLSVLIVCRDVDVFLLRTIRSIESIKPQILIDISDRDEALGIRKNRLIQQAAYEWVFILDTDETVSPELVDEVKKLVTKSTSNIHGFQIPYSNHIFGKSARFGGESYSRVQLFRKQYGLFTPSPVHEYPVVEGRIEKTSGVINHYSYRSLWGILTKFTKYAWQVAGEKRKSHERVTLKKLIMYGPHMVWARAIKDQGWRDGWRGIVIALCFGYMETLTYWFLLWRNLIGS